MSSIIIRRNAACIQLTGLAADWVSCGTGNFTTVTISGITIDGTNPDAVTFSIYKGDSKLYVGSTTTICGCTTMATSPTTNTAFGSGAGGNASTTGNSNTCFGQNAGHSLTSGYRNCLFGVNAGSALNFSYDNCFFGYEAGKNLVGNSLYNVGIGRGCMSTTTGGCQSNVCVGDLTGYSISSGGYNVFIGKEAGYSDNTQSYNTCVGYRSGYALGGDPLNGGFNTFLGALSGVAATGSYNTIVGYNAAASLVTGANNTVVGYGADITAPAASSCVVIGNAATSAAAETVVVGKSASAAAQGGIAIGANASCPAGAGAGVAFGNNTTAPNMISGTLPVMQIGQPVTAPLALRESSYAHLYFTELTSFNGAMTPTVLELLKGLIEYTVNGPTTLAVPILSDFTTAVPGLVSGNVIQCLVASTGGALGAITVSSAAGYTVYGENPIPGSTTRKLCIFLTAASYGIAPTAYVVYIC